MGFEVCAELKEHPLVAAFLCVLCVMSLDRAFELSFWMESQPDKRMHQQIGCLCVREDNSATLTLGSPAHLRSRHMGCNVCDKPSEQELSVHAIMLYYDTYTMIRYS